MKKQFRLLRCSSSMGPFMCDKLGAHVLIDTTSDHLLGGRVSYRQPGDGLRATLDPVLLAASIPARAGDVVLEGGTGAGAALLCLATRVPGVSGIGVDRDRGLLGLARDNAAANGLTGLSFVAADMTALPIRRGIDHAFANPPYHAPGGTPSPSPAREAAKRSAPDLLSVWTRSLGLALRHRGTLTLILPPNLLRAALDAMHASHVPAEILFPIWPMWGREARFVLVRGRKHGRTPLVLAQGMTLHDAGGAFRSEAEAILRGASPLPLSGASA
jgi:tRNA1(Val) A37 N6-methylase TrmN6